VTADVAPVQAKETSFKPSLFQDAYAQNNLDRSFQHYLEDEQRRLAFIFSPFSQFDFNSWFAYSDFSLNVESSADKVNLFSDIELASTETPPSNAEPNAQKPLSASEQAVDQIAAYFAKPSQSTLQGLLMKTGWLVPNLEASPQLFLAQLQGKLLNKLDLQFLVDQILSQVKIVKEKGKVELTLGLKPENLGEILLTLTSRSGMVSIQIQAPEETRKLIEAELKELELALKRAKVNLAEIKILATKEVDKHA
jgi:flagellar hook-length control protein FliK